MPFGFNPEQLINPEKLLEKGKEELEKTFDIKENNKEKGFKENKAELADMFKRVLEKIEAKTYENLPENEEEQAKLVEDLKLAQQAVNNANNEEMLQKALEEMNNKNEEIKKITEYETAMQGK